MEAKIQTIVDEIEEINPDCKIGIATIYYNGKTGVKYISTVTGAAIWPSYSLYSVYSKAVDEVQGYFKNTASADSNVYYIDTNELCNPAYLQTDSNGKLVDIHPNEAGQKAIANCFIRDCAAIAQTLVPKGELTEDTDGTATVSYAFSAISTSPYSADNAVMGDKISLSVDESGTGAKVYCNKSTDARTFEYTLKAAKAAGVLTGVSFWDNSNATEVLLRFEGTDTKNLKVCVGGNGTYIGSSIALGFDASAAEHTYSVEFDENLVTVTVDGSVMGTVDISSVNSPVSKVTPILFVEKADWVGTFKGNKVTSVFSDFH